MTFGDAGLVAHISKGTTTANPLKMFLSRYFYFSMSLLMAAFVLFGFGHTVNNKLFHANPPRPLLLWVHGAVFSTWVAFFILQSGLVRMRKVSVHRLLGWFGAGLAASVFALGFAISIIMARFHTVVLHQNGVGAFLSIPFTDVTGFGACMALAIYWRKRPEFHRRLVFMASCVIMDAAIARLDFWFAQNFFYVASYLLIVLGLLRDLAVDGRVHKVYLYAMPPMIAMQTLAVYAWKVNPAWWSAITRAILGV